MPWLDQTSHNIPEKQSLMQSKALTLQFCDAERGEEVPGESVKPAEAGSGGLGKEGISLT